MMARNAKTVSFISAHIFAPQIRKTSVHFIATEFAALGHDVKFISVGYSWLRKLKNCPRYAAISSSQRNQFEQIKENLNAGVYIAPLHAFSSTNFYFDKLSSILFPIYGSYFPEFAREAIRRSDLIVIETGTPIAFFDLCKSLSGSAKFIYLCRDHMPTIRASTYLQDLERRIIAESDSVCVHAQRLADLLPASGRITVVPQAIDPEPFRSTDKSPYPTGTVNAVSAGDMLLDRQVIAKLATAAPEVCFHVFGASWDLIKPANLIIHGEVGFEQLAAYIRHADFGIAAYATSETDQYLAESSLKLLQYAHCQLPVILPDSIPVDRGNEVKYNANNLIDARSLVDRCLEFRRSSLGSYSIPSWRQNALATLATVGINEHPFHSLA
ncbi:polysaccharide biosynthesis protein GumK [Pannonibacter carbonis]|uniref:GumK N-terminal domain-containing glycosyltransferase n=1 Tax=Pannonibacter carbonis TaxID=2067569 RepID=UPI00130063F8|nr:polysaccharide biosynthesis protein GumK [Pannonibacter carbonis]